VVCITGLLSTTWLRFQSFPLLYADRECYPEASTTSNSNESNVKLLTTAAMVDNLAEKVDECPLTRGHCIQLGQRKLSVILSSRVSTIQGLLKY